MKHHLITITIFLTSLCVLALPKAPIREAGLTLPTPIQSIAKPTTGAVLASFGELPVKDVPTPTPVVVAPKAPIAAPTPIPGVTNCGSDPYMAYIYQKESGCNTESVNSIGCRGLGQACPGSKLPCDNDWSCQDSWFRQYAVSRYGSIYAAYLFRTANNWW